MSDTATGTQLQGADRPAARRGSIRSDVIKYRAGRVLIYLVLTVGALVMLFPLAWMLLTSAKKQFYMEGENMVWVPVPWTVKEVVVEGAEGPVTEREVEFGLQYLTRVFTGENYAELLWRAAAKSSGASDSFLKASINSFIYSVVATFGNLLFCAMAGYAFAKKRFRGANFLLMAILATMMIPGIMVLLPNFVITVFGLHGYNNFAGLIVPGLAGSFGVFLMRQYMLSIPDDLINAAKVDGAGEFRTFFTIVLPLATPILAAYGILLVLGYWNNLLWPLVITKDLTVLQVALLNLREIGSQRLGPVMAGAVISSAPVIILFLALRKQFVRAMTSGALKG